MNTNNLITRVQNSRFGKIVRRIAGEESGQAMMEYVLIAVLVAAATAVAVWYFGRATQKELGVATAAVAAQNTLATQTQTTLQGEVQPAIAESANQSKNKIVTQNENVIK